jgi:hypothetical protein
MKPQQIYIYIIIICITIILGLDTFRSSSSREGFFDFNTNLNKTLNDIFNWLTSEYVLMPMILNLLIVGPLVFAIGKIYNTATAYIANSSS